MVILWLVAATIDKLKKMEPDNSPSMVLDKKTPKKSKTDMTFGQASFPTLQEFANTRAWERVDYEA
ncbi:hypothetical protein LTR10_014122 [Elasticomyces elasticus]|nr:hypothetical protein LTR10_014122 [Elasticomyces elasticus]KAK5026528.1 hypothetical protein LTS07_007462 [Exophiala sideris]KAK5180063.1 hypothetical protein LTR44_007539 [Eurotiomycetes sp. CCFEE 6388]